LLQAKALERATQLILEICGGAPGPIKDVVCSDEMPTKPSIPLRLDRIEKLLGVTIDSQKIEEILGRLGFLLSRKSDKDAQLVWQVVAPSFRYDIAEEVDLIEEIGRITGYNNLPSHLPKAQLQTVRHSDLLIPLARLNECLVDLGYQEAITYSFVDPKIQSLLLPDVTPLTLANPITQDMSQMRLSLWPGLIQAMLYNLKRQQSCVQLFESGLRFQFKQKALQQEAVIAGVLAGSVDASSWQSKERSVDFYDIKGHVESLYRLIHKTDQVQFVEKSHPALHPGQSAQILLADQPSGFVGALHPKLLKAWDISSPVCLFEILLDSLIQTKLPQFQSPSCARTLPRVRILRRI